MMRLRIIVLNLLVAIFVTGLGLACIIGEAEASPEPVPVDEPTILGISALEGRSLQLSVSEGSIVAYPTIEWHLILPAAATVDAVDSAGTIIAGDLAAGHYIFVRTYAESTAQSITWTIDGDVTKIMLSIVRSSSAAIGIVDPGDTISIDPGELVQLEREVAIGCILLVIAPSPFLIAFWKKRKDRGWSDAFDE